MTFTLLKMHLLNFYSANNCFFVLFYIKMNAGGHLHFVKQEETLWFQRLRGFIYIHFYTWTDLLFVLHCRMLQLMSLWPLPSKFRQQHSQRSAERLSLQLVGFCGLWVALFSPPTCMVEKQWCHSAGSPCYSVQAPPFDFERTVRSCIL